MLFPFLKSFCYLDFIGKGINSCGIVLKAKKVRVRRKLEGRHEIVEASLPALITASNEIGEPRYPTIKGIMAAKKKEPIIWKPADIGVDPSQIGAAGRRTKMLKLFQPVHEGKCEIIEAETPEEAGATLALKLREAKVL